MNILLISGHGAGDPGALGNGYEEAALTREVVALLKIKLTPYAKVTVFDTTKNMYAYLKSHSFNFKEFDYVLEVHFNAFQKAFTPDGKNKGVEILVHSSEKGVGVENEILKNISALGFTNRGIKRPNLQNMNICKGRQGVSYALIEVCFIDDADDMALYTSKKSAVIDAIVKGIKEGFGLGKTSQAEKYELTEVRDIVSALSERDIITDTALWTEKLTQDKNSYWLARKCANFILNM